ncbi:hypothetical protein Tco_1316446 [Tanacetum coccineum]
MWTACGQERRGVVLSYGGGRGLEGENYKEENKTNKKPNEWGGDQEYYEQGGGILHGSHDNTDGDTHWEKDATDATIKAAPNLGDETGKEDEVEHQSKSSSRSGPWRKRACGGISFGNSIRPHLQASKRQAEEEDWRVAEETRVVQAKAFLLDDPTMPLFSTMPILKEMAMDLLELQAEEDETSNMYSLCGCRLLASILSSWMIPFWDVYLEPNCEDEAVAVSAKCTIAKRKCSVDVVDIHRVFLGLGRAHSMVMPYLLGRLRNYEFIE